MKSRKDSGGGKATKKPQLSSEDKDIWEHSVRDVRPLAKGAGRATGTRKKSGDNHRSYIGFQPIDTIGDNNFISPMDQLDRNTDGRLRRGLMPIDARLDLHCMTQDQAYSALHNFIRQGYDRGCRCVLVITGTGGRYRRNDEEKPWYETAPGVLRERVPQWLRESKLAPMVLRFYPAQKRHGGNGAFYVLIRRRRER